MTFITIYFISVLMSVVPWAFIFAPNVRLQKIGLAVQILGLGIMIGNTTAMILGIY